MTLAMVHHARIMALVSVGNSNTLASVPLDLLVMTVKLTSMSVNQHPARIKATALIS